MVVGWLAVTLAVVVTSVLAPGTSQRSLFLMGGPPPSEPDSSRALGYAPPMVAEVRHWNAPVSSVPECSSEVPPPATLSPCFGGTEPKVLTPEVPRPATPLLAFRWNWAESSGLVVGIRKARGGRRDRLAPMKAVGPAIARRSSRSA